MEYIVMYGEDYFDLTQKVNLLLQKSMGWNLQGGVAVVESGGCYQALVKSNGTVVITQNIKVPLDDVLRDALAEQVQYIKDKQ